MEEDQKLQNLVLSFLSDDSNSLDDIENNIKDVVLSRMSRIDERMSQKIINNHLYHLWAKHSIMKKFNEIKNSPFIQRIRKSYDSDHNDKHVKYLLKLEESEYNFFDYLDHFISCIIAFLSLGYAPYESNLDLKEDRDEFVKFFKAYKKFNFPQQKLIEFNQGAQYSINNLKIIDQTINIESHDIDPDDSSDLDENRSTDTNNSKSFREVIRKLIIPARKTENYIKNIEI